jgi:polyhydroxyalkanoate synthesis regulator phasin
VNREYPSDYRDRVRVAEMERDAARAEVERLKQSAREVAELHNPKMLEDMSQAVTLTEARAEVERLKADLETQKLLRNAAEQSQAMSKDWATRARWWAKAWKQPAKMNWEKAREFWGDLLEACDRADSAEEQCGHLDDQLKEARSQLTACRAALEKIQEAGRRVNACSSRAYDGNFKVSPMEIGEDLGVILYWAQEALPTRDPEKEGTK